MQKKLQRVTRYINGLRYDIQDEINILSLRNVEESYQFYFKEKEKLASKQSERGRGRSPTSGRGQQSVRGVFQAQKEEAINSYHYGQP